MLGKGVPRKQKMECIDTKKKTNVSFFLLTVICMAIGGVIRVLYLWRYPVPVRDAFTYKLFIERWHQTGIIPEERGFPPLGLFILKIPLELFDCDIIKGGTCVNVILGLCIIVVAMYLSETIVSSNLISFFVGIITATHSTLIYYSCQMTRENSYLLFCALSILFFLKYLKAKQIYLLVLVSFLSATACLCRYEGMELVIVLGFIIMLRQKVALQKRIKAIVLFLMVFVLSFVVISMTINVPLNFYKSYGIVFQENLNPEQGI